MRIDYPANWIKFCSIMAALLMTSTTQAYSANDIASLQLHLTDDWKITDTRENPNVVKVVEYTRNAASNNKQILLQTTLEKPSNDHADTPYAKQLYLSSQKKLKDNECHYDDISHLSPNAGEQVKWGLYWECKNNQRTGFMLFIDADAKTLYTLTYKAEQTYPLSGADRNAMKAILRSAALCYQGKACAPLMR